MSIVKFDGPPSWPLDASETGESTKFPWVVGSKVLSKITLPWYFQEHMQPFRKTKSG